MTTAASQETAGWVRAESGRQVDGPPHTRALEHAPTLPPEGQAWSGLSHHGGLIRQGIEEGSSGRP